MYKLPSQFDPVPRGLAPSAGGGCCSCCCCCCVLTTVVTPILTSMHFYRTVPAPVAAQKTAAQATSAELPLEQAEEVSAPQVPESDKPAVSAEPPPSRALWATLGFFTLPLALWGGAIAWQIVRLIAAFLPYNHDDMASLIASIVVSILIFCGLFALLYNRFQKRPGHGFAVGLGAVFLYALVCAMEFGIWISLMK